MSGSGATKALRAMVVLLLVMTVVITAGCSASADTQDLRLSLRETRTAVARTELAIDLFERGRTTKAAAQVACSGHPGWVVRPAGSHRPHP